MPSAAAVLLAICVAAGTGVLDGALAAVGLRRRVVVVWAAATMALCAVNLPLPPHRPAVLWNPAGTVMPAAFAAFLLPRSGLRPRAFAGAAFASGLVLCGALAWAQQAGVGWPAAAAAAALAAAVLAGAARTRSGALAAGSAGIACAACARAAAALLGVAAWPAALGGGGGFAAGLLALVAAQAAVRVPGAWRWARPAAAVRPTAR